MKRRSLSKKRLAELWSSSSSCYSDAVNKLGYSNEIIRERYMDTLLTEEEALQLREALDEQYRKNLCNLDSKTLQDMVTADNKGLQRRAKITIDAIINELFERELTNEKRST